METDTECGFWSEWSSDRNAIIANGDTAMEIKESSTSFQKQNKKVRGKQSYYKTEIPA